MSDTERISAKYWLKAEAEAREIAQRTGNNAWTKLADLYREFADRKMKGVTK